MDVTDEGIAIHVNDEQSRKVESPMDVIEEGISIHDRDEQSRKAR